MEIRDKKLSPIPNQEVTSSHQRSLLSLSQTPAAALKQGRLGSLVRFKFSRTTSEKESQPGCQDTPETTRGPAKFKLGCKITSAVTVAASTY